jgi:hypothetical protein
MLILVTQIFFASPAFPADSLFALIAALFSSILVGVLLMLQLPKYCLYLKTNSELYVLTIKDSGDFTKIKLFAEKIVEQIERSLEENSQFKKRINN